LIKRKEKKNKPFILDHGEMARAVIFACSNKARLSQ
jgi:hypothetical protein